MLESIGTGLTSVISWCGSVVNALVNTSTSSPGAWSALLPVFTVGIAVSFVLLGVKIIRSFTFGA